MNTLPRHQNLRNRGCAAGMNHSFTHGGEMEPWRYTNAPASSECGCGSADHDYTWYRAGVLAKLHECRCMHTHALTGWCSVSRNRRSKDRDLTVSEPLSCIHLLVIIVSECDRLRGAAAVLPRQAALAACARLPRAHARHAAALAFGRCHLGLSGQLWRSAGTARAEAVVR